MCGIVGILGPGPVDTVLLRRMTGALRHRGPDDENIWIDGSAGVGLGHRRLAVLDLSPAGRQPMASACGRYLLTLNGEVYDHLALRGALDRPGGPRWRGHSDTETLVEAIAHWGLETALSRCAGMFALGLWDRVERRLSLARDRLGEKPLYYGRLGRDFAFASELRALRLHPAFDPGVDRHALGLLAMRAYVPAPRSIHAGIAKLEPASILTIDAGGEQRIHRYWSYREMLERGLADPWRDRDEAGRAIEEALALTVSEQAVADVPVGMFLSGGVDSSAVAALYRARADAPLRTYSIGFEEAAFDESAHAEAVARFLGAEHCRRRFTVADARAVIPDLPVIYDEPFADPAQMPTLLLARLAREQVTVALTGDGGDELFGGYTRYRHAARLARIARLVPARQSLSGLRRLPLAAALDRTLAHVGRAGNLADLYASFRDAWTGEPSPVIGAGEEEPLDLDVAGAWPILRMMHADATSYLPDDILCKVDRAAMSVGLETRLPLLDHRVAAAVARAPQALRGAPGKVLLRDILSRHLPRTLFDRPKAGFSVPIGDWLNGPLRDWAEALLAPDRLRSDGYFRPAPIGRRWRDHRCGRRDASASLWPILMFNAWLDQGGFSPPPEQTSLRATIGGPA